MDKKVQVMFIVEGVKIAEESFKLHSKLSPSTSKLLTELKRTMGALTCDKHISQILVDFDKNRIADIIKCCPSYGLAD